VGARPVAFIGRLIAMTSLLYERQLDMVLAL
jgi:hypothetical protein